MRGEFIGRDREVAELLAGVEGAFRGRGAVFLLSGEPGIGKTSLAEQVANEAAERGARVAWSRSWDGAGAGPYWLWAQIVRSLAEGADEESQRMFRSPGMAHLGVLAPELADRFGDPTQSILTLESDAGRFYLFESTAMFLKQLSSREPLVLVLDDVLAADHPSLLLLQFLSRDIRSSRILVVATYRDTDATRSAEAVEVLADLVREGYLVRLRAFDRAEVGRLITGLSGVVPWQDKVQAIHQATGGNPLFVREVTRLIATQDPLERPGRLSIPVPDSVRAVIRRRLALLTADAIQVLSAAAVVGQDFHLTLVGVACEMPAERVLASLAEAVGLGIIAETTGRPGWYRFSHPLMREAIYEGLPVGARTQMHHRVALAIERVYAADPVQHLGELAYHFAKVAALGESAKACEYARRAGDQAMDSFAYEDAVVHYQRALDALAVAPDPDPALRCELLLNLGRAQARSGDYQQSKATSLLAAEIARTLDDPEQLARAALGFGEPQVEGGLVDRQLVDLLQEAIARLSSGDSALRARAVARLSLELTFSDDAMLRESVRESLSLEAIEMARRLGDVVALCNALRARWLAVWGPDGLEERCALAEEHIALARQTGDREIELLARARRSTCALESGDSGAAVADIAAHGRLAEELRMPYHEWAAATMRAGRTLLAGSLSDVEALAEEAAARLPARPNARHALVSQLTVLRWEQGRLGEMHQTWQDVVEEYPGLAFAKGWLGLAAGELGRTDAASAVLRELVKGAATLPRNGLWHTALALASLAAAHLEDADAAAELYPILRPYADRAVVIAMPHPVVCFGSVSLYLGLLATEMAAWDEAEAHFREATRANRRLGARAFLVRTRSEFARMLLRRGRGNDRDRASRLLDRAAAAGASMGMAGMAARIANLRAGVPQSPEAAAQRVRVRLADGARTQTQMLRREGEYWTVAYDGTVVRLRDSKGLRCLARLLASPGREYAAVDLEESETAGSPSALVPAGPLAAGDVRGELELQPDLGDAGAMLDAQARAAYKTRLDELREELDEAEGFNDPGRAAAAREEMDFLTSEISRAVGLGGRDRKAHSHAERARLNVTRAIRAAMKSIDRVHPSLSHHLSLTIRTGRLCSYSPDPRAPITWQT